MFDKGMFPGFENALLVTGDQRYVDVLRGQMANMYAQKKMVDGKLMIPQNYGDQGWYNWTPQLYTDRLLEIYLLSMNRADLEYIPMAGWVAFLEGKNPDYPEKALQNDFKEIRRLMELMRKDPTTPDTRLADWAMNFNPATTRNLVNLMLGGQLNGVVYMLHSRVRYFDPVAQRAGIPEDVAALVQKMGPEEVVLTLVNVNPVHVRTVTVQMGAYAEHHCTKVSVGGRAFTVDAPYFHVRLEPGAGETLTITQKRWAHQPTLAFPWDRSWMVRN